MKRIVFILTLIFALSPVSAQLAGAAKSDVINARALLRDVQILSADEMQGRAVGTEGGLKAREYVAKRFGEMRLEPFAGSYFQPFDFIGRADQKISGANVVGFVEGRKFKDRYIVVSAHYDHVGVLKGEIYNGADDNASGTAALIALAEYFRKKRPQHTVIFAAFDAEEAGLGGSRAFVSAPPVAKEKIALNVNVDMVSHNDKNELYAAGTYHYPQLRPALEKVAREAKIKLLFGHDRPELGNDDWTNQSDHAAFHAARIPFVYFGVEDHKDYHRPTDDFANINQEFYVRAVETVLAAVKGFDKNLK